MTIEELSKLSDEELRVRCAELCGWTQLNPGTWEHRDSRMSVWPFSSVPNYPADLNAMHEAEKTIEHLPDYLFRVREVVGPFPEAQSEWDDHWWSDVVLATARQRCIAFIAVKQSA